MSLTLPLPIDQTKVLTLNLRAFVNGAIPVQTVQVICDGKKLGGYSLSKFEDNIIKVDIPASAKQKGYINLELNVPYAASPASIGMDNDTRELGIGIVSARFD